jgi:hypothetical protein
MKESSLNDLLNKIAELKFPYETEDKCPDQFTRDLRNGTIDMLRNAYILGACDILKGYAKDEEKKQSKTEK